MAEEKKIVIDGKDRSKTDVYKEHLQKIIFQQLGVKVSKDKAWSLFKAVMHGTTEFVLAIEPEVVEAKEEGGEEKNKGRKLPLAGVGTFCILETKPRGSKAGLDKDGNPIEGAKVWPCVPRFRFYPSSVTDKRIEQEYGLAEHGVEIEHYGIFVDGDAAPAPAEEEVKKEDKKSDKKDAKKDGKAGKDAKADKKAAPAPAEEEVPNLDDEEI